MSTPNNQPDYERSIWGDDDILDEGEELVVIRSQSLDNAPLPERVSDLPQRQAPRRFSEVLDETETDLNEWTPELTPEERRPSSTLENTFALVKFGTMLAMLFGIIGGLGFLVYWAFVQYGVV